MTAGAVTAGTGAAGGRMQKWRFAPFEEAQMRLRPLVLALAMATGAGQANDVAARALLGSDVPYIGRAVDVDSTVWIARRT